MAHVVDIGMCALRDAGDGPGTGACEQAQPQPCHALQSPMSYFTCNTGGNVGLEGFASGGFPGISMGGMGRRERRQRDAQDEQAK